MIEIDRVTARALVEAGYMPLCEYFKLCEEKKPEKTENS